MGKKFEKRHFLQFFKAHEQKQKTWWVILKIFKLSCLNGKILKFYMKLANSASFVLHQINQSSRALYVAQSRKKLMGGRIIKIHPISSSLVISDLCVTNNF